jgi:hypothetical protein
MDKSWRPTAFNSRKATRYGAPWRAPHRSIGVEGRGMATNGKHRNLGGPAGFPEVRGNPLTSRRGEDAEMTIRESDRFVVEV